MEGLATTAATVRGNLNANAKLSPSQFSTTQTVTDPNTNTSHELTLSWERVNGTQWTVTPSSTSATAIVAPTTITVESDVNGVIYSPQPGSDAVSIGWSTGALTTTHNLLGTNTTHASTASFGDPSGTSQTAALSWTRVSGNLWDVTVTVPATVGTIADPTVRVAFDGQGRMISPSTASLPFVIDWADSYDSADSTKMNSEISLYVGSDLPANQLTRPDIHVEKLSTQVWDSNFESHDASLAFERIGPNQWYVHGYSTASTYGDAPPPPKLVTFTSTGVMSTYDPTLGSDWSWTDSVV
mgnify:CR=1 FL=1